MLCAKCRQTPPADQDSWCLGCTGVEALGIELAASWKLPAFRAAAHDVVVSAVRGVKALRTLSGCCVSADASRAAAETHPPRGSSVPARAPNTTERARSRAPAPPPPPFPPPVKEQEESYDEESGEEEEESEDKVVGACPKASAGKRPPPEPEHPPEPRHYEQEPPRSSRKRSVSIQRRKPKRKRREGHSRGNRGGSRHPRAYRQLHDPSIRIHRKQPASYWESDRSFAGYEPRRDRR